MIKIKFRGMLLLWGHQQKRMNDTCRNRNAPTGRVGGRKEKGWLRGIQKTHDADWRGEVRMMSRVR
jgi:hypothetical protein